LTEFKDHLQKLLSLQELFSFQEVLIFHASTRKNYGTSSQTMNSELETLSEEVMFLDTFVRIHFSRTIRSWLTQKQTEELLKYSQRHNTLSVKLFVLLKKLTEPSKISP